MTDSFSDRLEDPFFQLVLDYAASKLEASEIPTGGYVDQTNSGHEGLHFRSSLLDSTVQVMIYDPNNFHKIPLPEGVGPDAAKIVWYKEFLTKTPEPKWGRPERFLSATELSDLTAKVQGFTDLAEQHGFETQIDLRPGQGRGAVEVFTQAYLSPADGKQQAYAQIDRLLHLAASYDEKVA